MSLKVYVWFGLLLSLQVLELTSGHGRLLMPVSRASAWRKGFNVPPDYTDNQGFCGGIAVQYNSVNNGRCGVCGDADSENPGAHEAPGQYATGIIVQRYTSGQTINVEVQITAHHKGFFQFKICPNEDFSRDKGQDCFDRNTLLVGPSFTGTKWMLPAPTSAPMNYQMQVKLPPGLVCNKQCIFQWTYTTGNNWGICPDGSGALGCGNQETFRACSDVIVSGSGTGTSPPIGSTQKPPTAAPTTATTTKSPSGGSCVAIPPWSSTPGMNDWCNANCNHVPPNCPSSMCSCS